MDSFNNDEPIVHRNSNQQSTISMPITFTISEKAMIYLLVVVVILAILYSILYITFPAFRDLSSSIFHSIKRDRKIERARPSIDQSELQATRQHQTNLNHQIVSA